MYTRIFLFVSLHIHSQWGDYIIEYHTFSYPRIAYLKSVLPVVVMVMFLEVVVDSIKHAFITKFNDISPDVYRKYRTILAMDFVTCRQDTVSLWYH